jgi:hypothetical protein
MTKPGLWFSAFGFRILICTLPLLLRTSNTKHQTPKTKGQRPKAKDQRPMPAKVIRIIARLNVGGPAKHVVWLTDGLKKTRYQTLLVSGRVPPGEGDMGYFAEQSGVSPCFIPEMSREISLNDRGYCLEVVSFVST